VTRGQKKPYYICLSVCFCCLSSYRAKGASNNNDAGGSDDSDLEKMKQVNGQISTNVLAYLHTLAVRKHTLMRRLAALIWSV